MSDASAGTERKHRPGGGDAGTGTDDTDVKVVTPASTDAIQQALKKAADAEVARRKAEADRVARERQAERKALKRRAPCCCC